MKIGFIGLGKMGFRMASKLLKDGHELVVWNRSSQPLQQFKSENPGVKTADSIGDLVQHLDVHRVIWSMLPAGDATQSILDELAELVERDDIIIDGGNAFYKDTEKRYQYFKKMGVRFLGIGVSGGVIAAQEGYPLMVGGSQSAYDQILPLLDSLAKPHGGHQYFGEGGAGHFVKMVHNGIEYSYMQGLGEGFGVLEKSPYNLDLKKVAELYQKGTLISGFMIDRTVEALDNDPGLQSIQGIIAESGEATWTVQQGKDENVYVENIEQALEFRRRSQTDKNIQESFAARMVAALRNAFGGHAVKKK